MACIFCDQTPETENAVEALAAIKAILGVIADKPVDIVTAVEMLSNRDEAKSGVIVTEREKRRHVEERYRQCKEELNALQETVVTDLNRRTTPPVYRGPSSSPSRGGGMWGHQEEALRKWDDYMPYVEKPNGKSGRHAMPYGHTSKKDRVK